MNLSSHLVRLAFAAALMMPSLLLADDARTFTNKAGKTLEAEVVAATDKEVTLRLANGQRVPVALMTLSEADVAYVKQWRAQAADPDAVIATGKEKAREFTERGGKKFLATIVKASDKKVTLKLADGKQQELPLSKLSLEDQVYLLDWAIKASGLEDAMEKGKAGK
jgi:16S rRNA U1498 N3-methylase RsmE